MILAQQFISRVLRDATKCIVDVANDSALIGNRDDRGLVERELDMRQLFLRALKLTRPAFAA